MRVWRRLLFRWRRAQLEYELEEELEYHRLLKQQEIANAGLTPEQAAWLSSRQMGNTTLAREESRDMWSFLALEQFWQDLRYAARMFAKSPVFTFVASISLAIGIGGNAAVFSLVNTLLIRPLPYSEPERLVRISEVYPKAAYVLIRDRSRTMDVASVSPGAESNLTGQGEPVRLFGSAVSTNLLSVLRAPLERGRGFESGEDQPGRDAVVILSHALWQTKFSSDTQILGRVIELDGVGRRIVGVMPPAFSYPSAKVQFWIPARLDPSIMEEYWGAEFTPIIGRLRPGASIAQARAELPAMVTEVRNRFPFPMKRDWNAQATVISLQEDLVGDFRGKLFILLSSVGIVLLIACANVASLLLSRATARRKEIALRAALGAGRIRIFRQLLTESILLSLVGGSLGILIAMATLSVFRNVLPPDTPGLAQVAIDLHVLAFAASLAICTGLAFGIAPALISAQIRLTEAIKTGGQRSTSRGWMRMRSWLIGGELALSVVLVVAAGLLIKTLYLLSQVNPGFHPEQILTVRITPNQSACKERAACVAMYDELVRRARTVPGVSSAAVANTIPLDGEYEASSIPVDLEGHPKTADFPAPMFLASTITADYLPMMRVPLLAGRRLTSNDVASSQPVLVISASTAKRYWPGESAIGKHIKPTSDREWKTVVGVVADVRHHDLANKAPDWITGSIYMPYAQTQQLPAAMNLLVKTASDPARVSADLRSLVTEVSPNVPVSQVHTMQSILDASITDRRATMGVFLSFAAAAILLAAVGIYGLVSYSVTQRTYEIGLRKAIGATKSNVVGLVVKQSLRIAVSGIGAGLIAAVLLTRFLSSFLYGVTATDPLTFSAVSVLLMGIAIGASSVPAWRAAQIDPTKSLRMD